MRQPEVLPPPGGVQELLKKLDHLSPSSITRFMFCSRLWDLEKIQRKDVQRRLSWPPLAGTFFHEAAAAVDTADDPERAILDAATRERERPTYDPQDSPLIDQIAEETLEQIVPKYDKYVERTDDALQRTQISVEQRHVMSLPGVPKPLFVIPDKVVEEPLNGVPTLWCVERKLTTGDNPNWLRRWTMDLQTTLQCLAVEQALDKPVAGVYLEQVVVTRKRKKEISWLPQPIHNIVFWPPRAVFKSDIAKRDAVATVQGVWKEMVWRYSVGLQREPRTISCKDCHLTSICSGRTRADWIDLDEVQNV